MRVKPIFWVIAAGGLSALAASAQIANARLPYHLLYNAQKTRIELNAAHTNLLVVLTMQSTQAGVASSNLAVFIDARAGRIPVEIGTAGDFSIPMRDDLLAEDPWVNVNQPRGTMKLNWEVGLLPGRITNSIRYAHLMRPLRESEDIQDNLRRAFGGGPRRSVTGLRLTFPRTQPRALAIVHAKDGNHKLEANENGEIILPLSDDLLNEDPEVTFSGSPAAVEIVSHTSEN